MAYREFCMVYKTKSKIHPQKLLQIIIKIQTMKLNRNNSLIWSNKKWVTLIKTKINVTFCVLFTLLLLIDVIVWFYPLFHWIKKKNNQKKKHVTGVVGVGNNFLKKKFIWYMHPGYELIPFWLFEVDTFPTLCAL